MAQIGIAHALDFLEPELQRIETFRIDLQSLRVLKNKKRRGVSVDAPGHLRRRLGVSYFSEPEGTEDRSEKFRSAAARVQGNQGRAQCQSEPSLAYRYAGEWRRHHGRARRARLGLTPPKRGRAHPRRLPHQRALDEGRGGYQGVRCFDLLTRLPTSPPRENECSCRT